MNLKKNIDRKSCFQGGGCSQERRFCNFGYKGHTNLYAKNQLVRNLLHCSSYILNLICLVYSTNKLSLFENNTIVSSLLQLINKVNKKPFPWYTVPKSTNDIHYLLYHLTLLVCLSIYFIAWIYAYVDA